MYHKPFSPGDYNQADPEAQLAARGAQVLKIALDFNALVATGSPIDVALGTLQARGPRHAGAPRTSRLRTGNRVRELTQS